MLAEYSVDKCDKSQILDLCVCARVCVCACARVVRACV